MTQSKFIITMNGYLRMGMVSQHKHLLKLTCSFYIFFVPLHIRSK